MPNTQHRIRPSQTVHKQISDLLKQLHQLKWREPDNIPIQQTLGKLVASEAGWEGQYIVEAFLAALEDANYHSLRAKLADVLRQDGFCV